MWRKSITLRLTLLFAATSAAVLVALGTVIGQAVEAHFEEQDLAEINSKLESARYIISKVRSPAEMDAIPQHLGDALIGHHGLSVAVFTPGNRPVFTTPGADLLKELLAARPNESGDGRSTPLVWESGGRAYRGVAMSVPSGVVAAGPFTVAVALDISHHREFMAAFRKTLWGFVAFGILLTGFLGWFAARRGLAPVRNIARVAKGISATRLGDRLPYESVPPELADLAASFNGMLGRLEDSFRRLSDFSSDLAHELRTPVSNLMTQTQVALARSRSAEEYREILYSNLEEYDRLARMIADMLFLAKADHGLIVPNRENIDLANEVDELIGFYEALAEENSVRVSRIGIGSIPGDRLMIRRAISNLLSNAIRHTPRGGLIKVEVRALGNDGIRIAVENPGEAIPQEQLQRLFDRFYRADPCRQRSSEGAGLGLAITKSIVEAHGGAISVSTENGAVRFEISIGMAAKPTPP
jgi:two-component system heavy metal sensor histidine kinase CusS